MDELKESFEKIFICFVGYIIVLILLSIRKKKIAPDYKGSIYKLIYKDGKGDLSPFDTILGVFFVYIFPIGGALNLLRFLYLSFKTFILGN